MFLVQKVYKSQKIFTKSKSIISQFWIGKITKKFLKIENFNN